MEIYVLGCKIVLPPFYWLCKPRRSYHELHINNTKTIHSKNFPKTLNFYSQTFYSHHNFVQKKGAFQGHKHLLKY